MTVHRGTWATADELNFEKGGGVVTVVTQDAISGAVLMVAAMDREAFDKTCETGEMHYRSRTRGLWHKGATSGHVQRVVSLTADCDGDAMLARVHSAGPACHTGSDSCFGATLTVGDVISTLANTIEARAADGGGLGLSARTPDTVSPSEKPSYTKRLLQDRNLRLKKLGEEAAELVLALADRDTRRAAEEGADLLYHMLVALHAGGVSIGDVRSALAARATKAGSPS